MTLPSGKPLQQQVTQLARYDVLTGLPSRGVFLEAMEQAIARARRKSQSFAVLVRFKMPLELENDVAAILTEFGLPPQLLESE